MNEELQQYLVEQYPLIFRDYNGDPKKTAMCWGIECGDGWFWIIDALCANIRDTHAHLARWSDTDIDFESPVASQIKEKFGGLRFYIDGGLKGAATDTFSMITMAESMSTRTCEHCGCPGSTTHGGWSRTECVDCRYLRQADDDDATTEHEYHARRQQVVEDVMVVLRRRGDMTK